MGMHSPHPTFSIFLINTIYNFSIFLNFSDDSDPYALSQSKSKMSKKCIIFGEGHRVRGEKNQAKFAVKITRKALKWP